MSVWTPLNLEQSIASYLASKFKTEGYDIYWLDTNTTESVGGSETITFLREFPSETKNFARQSVAPGPGKIIVPAFSVFANNPSTSNANRMGIGEGAFEWQMSLRVDGFVDTEYQWFQFLTYFKDWFGHPDTRVPLSDYEADINSVTPTVATESIHFEGTDLFRRELNEQPAARYYLNMTTTATFME